MDEFEQMKIFHTSDWHLGKRISDIDRTQAFKAFLNWLIHQIKEHQPELLIIAGDIFDSISPSHSAQKLYYEFLCQLNALQNCSLVITAGNHDSASFLEAPKDLLEHLNIYVVGAPSNNPNDEVLIIKDKKEQPIAIICAVPFLKERDLYKESAEGSSDREALILNGIIEHYKKSLEIAKEKRGNSRIPIVATGHLFTNGTSASDEERILYLGNLGHVPIEAFPKGFDYLALGHIHQPQVLSSPFPATYSGSPLVLDFSERNEQKLIRSVDFTSSPPFIENIEVPAFDRLIRISGDEAKIQVSIEALLEKCEKDHIPIFLEIEYTGGTQCLNLYSQTQSQLEGSGITLVRIKDSSQSHQYLNSIENKKFFELLNPQSVFEKRLSLLSEEAIGDTARIEQLKGIYRWVCQEAQEEIQASTQKEE